jgi:hypothetical protein
MSLYIAATRRTLAPEIRRFLSKLLFSESICPELRGARVMKVCFQNGYPSVRVEITGNACLWLSMPGFLSRQESSIFSVSAPAGEGWSKLLRHPLSMLTTIIR